MDGWDMNRFLAASNKLDLDGVDFDAVARHRLRADEVRCLTYMMDIETHTVLYLRDLLSTPAVYDPDVTAFLSLWVYEEFWHGEALGRFLRAAGHARRSARTTAIRRASDRSGLARAFKGVAAKLLPEFVAVHMTWGAVNELSTLTGYQRVIARTDHPILVELLRRIIKDERRHYAFYAAQARARLAASERARRVVRWALETFWQPVGTGVRPQRETDFVIATLFCGDDGARAAASIEQTLAALPGLAGLRIVREARARALRRIAPRGRSAIPIAAHV